MRHERIAVILSTGGAGIVKAAYSQRKPAFGVGPGNVPVLVDTSADLEDAIPKIVAGKSFDYGTVCSSEQAIVGRESSCATASSQPTESDRKPTSPPMPRRTRSANC